MADATTGAPERSTYRHGDVRRVLPAPPTPLVRAFERSAPPTCDLPKKKRDCSPPPSRSPTKRAANRFRQKAGNSGLNPFQLLGAALDRLADAGVLPPERRPGSEYLAWSAVRGLAMLLTEGPLRRLTSAERDVIGQRLLDMVEKGL